MKIWEAIIYGVIGGITELLPISWNGHYAFLRGTFNLSSLTENGGYYVRAAICLGVMVAIVFGFSGELYKTGNEFSYLLGIKKPGRGYQKDKLTRRTMSLLSFALLPLLVSLIYRAAADRMIHLLYTALIFGGGGFLLYLCFRDVEGKKADRETTLLDALLMGLASAVSVFPGLSVVGSSLAVGHARGLSPRYGLRFSYSLLLVFEGVSFFYYLIRAFVYGSFSASVLLPMLLAMLFSAVFGYFAIQYLRYMLERKKLGMFSCYCWTLSIVMLILSLINA